MIISIREAEVPAELEPTIQLVLAVHKLAATQLFHLVGLPGEMSLTTARLGVWWHAAMEASGAVLDLLTEPWLAQENEFELEGDE